MACSCLNNSSGLTLFRTNASNDTSQEDCGYSQETLMNWKSTLECLKNTQKYDAVGLTVYDINVFLGNIISAVNNSICSFSTKLDQLVVVR